MGPPAFKAIKNENTLPMISYGVSVPTYVHNTKRYKVKSIQTTKREAINKINEIIPSPNSKTLMIEGTRAKLLEKIICLIL